MIKKIFVILIVFIMVLSTNVAVIFAATKSELENEKSSIDTQIQEKKSEINQIEEEKSEIMKEVQALTAEISTYETEIEELNGQISELNAKIGETEIKLKEAEEKCEQQNINLQKRLVALYEAGETSYLDVLLNSKDISNFVTNYYLVSEIATIDAELLEQLENSKKEIEEAKQVLDESKSKVEEAKKEQETKANQLKSAQWAKQDKVNGLTDEEKELQKEIEQYEKDKQDLQRQINAIIAANNASSSSSSTVVTSGTPSSYGYIFPIQGLGLNNISNKNYPSYAGHTGVDININTVGKNVVAVKSGTVEISTALTGSIPTYNSAGQYLGSYRSYGEYILINHHDGTMTLYGHMYPGSRRVSKGDKVVQGQVIGTVGNTGNCYPRPTASSPYNGTHLHFEVRVNGKCVNPIPYLR